jgi:hypothetical protein
MFSFTLLKCKAFHEVFPFCLKCIFLETFKCLGHGLADLVDIIDKKQKQKKDKAIRSVSKQSLDFSRKKIPCGGKNEEKRCLKAM